MKITLNDGEAVVIEAVGDDYVTQVILRASQGNLLNHTDLDWGLVGKVKKVEGVVR